MGWMTDRNSWWLALAAWLQSKEACVSHSHVCSWFTRWVSVLCHLDPIWHRVHCIRFRTNSRQVRHHQFIIISTNKYVARVPPSCGVLTGTIRLVVDDASWANGRADAQPAAEPSPNVQHGPGEWTGWAAIRGDNRSRFTNCLSH